MNTLPFWFSTDLQVLYGFNITTHGISNIKETVFENRMNHVKELNRMEPKLLSKIILQKLSESKTYREEKLLDLI